MANFNEDYIHVDLKNENMVYNFDDSKNVLKAVLIDLDDIIDKKTFCKTIIKCPRFDCNK